MIAGDRINLFEVWDAETLKVSTPRQIVLVCGGTTDAKRPNELTRRDAFMSICVVGDFAKYEFFKAEDVELFAPRAGYDDVLTFEIDIAQLAHVVLLFCESSGSFAELGSFCMDQDITQRLLVVIDDRRYDEDSFIKHGPIKFLEDLHPDTAVLVLKTKEIGQAVGSYGKDIDKVEFGKVISTALKKRMREVRDDQTFNPNRSGHMIKFMTGLIQDYGALKQIELEGIMGCVGYPVTGAEFRRYMLCAEAMGWIARDRRNLETYYTATSHSDALRFKYEDGKVFDRPRWRTDIMQYWREKEPDRFASILANRQDA